MGRAWARPWPCRKALKWAEPLQVINSVTYRADGEGYLKPGFNASLYGVGGGRLAAPADFRGLSTRAAVWAGLRMAAAFLVSANRDKNWDRRPYQA